MEVSNFYRARKTMLELLKDRGYNVDLLEKNFPSLKEFKKKFNTKKRDFFHCCHKNNINEIIVQFINKEKLKPNILRENINYQIKNTFINSSKTYSYIAVTREKPNNSIKKIKQKHPFMELFWVKRLVINITKHKLVPKHIWLNEEEKIEFFKKYNIQDTNQIPIILRNDPIVLYYGRNKGDICKITRISVSSGKINYYRIVK